MKREVISKKIINVLEQKLVSLESSLKQTEDSVKQAPTAMESHSDTSRFQFGQLANNLRAMIKNINGAIKEISENKTLTGEITQGSIIEIEREDKAIYYVISSFGLGEPLKIDGDEVLVISAGAPIAKNLIGKKEGDEIKIETPAGDYEMRIRGAC